MPVDIPIIALLLGVLAGFVTGVLPGIHVNTITALLLASTAAGMTTGLDFTAVITFICAMAIAHTFFDVIPGLFLGVPNDTAFALLPGHRLVAEGRGREAVKLSVGGSLLGLFIGLGAIALFLSNSHTGLLLTFNRYLTDAMFWILAAICMVLILSEPNKLAAALTFSLSGIFGVLVLGAPITPGGTDAAVNVLFPVLAGMFGLAGLIYAIHISTGQSKKPEFSNEKKITYATLAWPSLRGGLSGGAVGLLPGLGVANAATLLLLFERFLGRGQVSGDESDRRYLVTTSALNTAEAIFAIAALYLIGKSRSGVSVALDKILGIVSIADVWAIMAVFLLSGLVAAGLLYLLARPLALAIASLNATSLSTAVIAFIVLLTGLLLGAGGLFVLGIATLIGLAPILGQARRAQLMGFFLVPVLLFYSGHQPAITEILQIPQKLAPLLEAPDVSGITTAIIVSVLITPAFYFVAQRTPINQRIKHALYPALGILIVSACLWVWLQPETVPAPRPATAGSPSQFTGQVQRVIDGDTLELTSKARRYRVRLAYIDAPEMNQPGGVEATDFAEQFINGRDITWTAVGVDPYGRILADILVNGISLNRKLVEQGHAWVYPFYRDDEDWMQLETRAQKQGIGLWQADKAMAPWDWRRLH